VGAAAGGVRAALARGGACVNFRAPRTLPAQLHAPRTLSPAMGLFDGVKKAFGEESALPAADRVTPIDRWMGLDKALVEEDTPTQGVTYVDPANAANYIQVSLAKPMGIAFVENDSGSGVYIDEVLDEGSARGCGTRLEKGDQLVGVDGTLVAGASFDEAFDAIKASTAEATKLTFFRGPTTFLYGPTAPSAEWYEDNLRIKEKDPFDLLS